VDIWGDIPVPLLRHLDLRRYLYGYIGLEDRTMAPLIPPGSFVQIDAKRTRVKKSLAGKSPGNRSSGGPSISWISGTATRAGGVRLKTASSPWSRTRIRRQKFGRFIILPRRKSLGA